MVDKKTGKDNGIVSGSAVDRLVTASRRGVHTTEFRGKSIVQVLLLVAIGAGKMGFDVNLDEETAIMMIAGLEATYTFARSLVKAFLPQA